MVKTNKKIMIILFSTVLCIGLLFVRQLSFPIEHEEIDKDELINHVYMSLQNNFLNENFSIYSDEQYTYVLYRSDLKHGDYITTSLDVRKKWGKYIVVGQTSYAANDNLISLESMVRFNKISKDKIITKEKQFN
ncbi:hypothetical protein [Paenibacillus sp. NPDC058071]|uniref:hypothetical protein n=1 Tax=Paenibacillus sp. NPDC058071 TaxID=3346326 RepID=UPI0036D7D449